MNQLPDRPNLDHLKKQAKDLRARSSSRDPVAIDRIRRSLPGAADKDASAIAKLGLRLHDAQSCIAREYGFRSWGDLKSFVEARGVLNGGSAQILRWLRLVYAADIAGGVNQARPLVAARILEGSPALLADDPYLACAIGDEAKLRRVSKDDPGWVNRPGGALDLPPLVAVTHSTLVQLPAFRDGLHASARLLLETGADPNQGVGSRWPPASLSEPSKAFQLSVLYGAAGRNHDPKLTKLLLEAGADPNDGESLYHSLENPTCTHLLLEAGARITGTNGLYRVLDLDSIDALRLLLSHGADPNEPPGGPTIAAWGSPLLWAIRRRRSQAHISALLDAGADPSTETPDGTNPYTLALRFGLPDVAKLLSQVDGAGHISEGDRFIAACTQGDEATARAIQSRRSDLPDALAETQLRLLPELAAQGCDDAVRLMVRLGWPIAVTGGDWAASALNHAVFRGNATLARFLLEHGASWTEQHGHGDNACGTLSWASCNEAVDGGDWLGCAEALVAHGMPAAEPDPQGPDSVSIDGQSKRFSDEVTEYLLNARMAQIESLKP